jgi:hypothetical protein
MSFNEVSERERKREREREGVRIRVTGMRCLGWIVFSEVSEREREGLGLGLQG